MLHDASIETSGFTTDRVDCFYCQFLNFELGGKLEYPDGYSVIPSPTSTFDPTSSPELAACNLLLKITCSYSVGLWEMISCDDHCSPTAMHCGGGLSRNVEVHICGFHNKRETHSCFSSMAVLRLQQIGWR
jgi:hypothetical protein